MKKLFLVLVLCIFSLNAIIAQNKVDLVNKVDSVLVTESMADKIADVCLLNKGYTLTIFYKANSKQLSTRDIYNGKGREILLNLNKYPKYSENFIREIFRIWGYNGLKEIGFNDKEILISKEIINKLN